MSLKKIIVVAVSCVSMMTLSACSETRYAAHLAKQIPMPGDQPVSQGKFKVGNPYNIAGRNYYPRETYSHIETGIASWYGPNFHGKKTANGEYFDKNELTAAHRTLQMPSIIRVTNLNNGRTAILRVNDRGPFAHDRVLDVSERAASMLGFKNIGTAKVKIEVLSNESMQVASAAKQGLDTRGYEVALNQNKSRLTTQAPIPPTLRREPITQVALSNPSTSQQPVPVIPLNKPETVQSEQLASVMAPTPVSKPTSMPKMHNPLIGTAHAETMGAKKVYVQAGSFSQEQNALNYSSQISGFGQSKVYLTRVNDQPYFRVRLGPYDNREQAQRILTSLNESGNKNAVIVID